MSQSRRNFTLIELLVVVFILAIIISILLPSLSNARKRSLERMAARDIKEPSAYAGAMQNGQPKQGDAQAPNPARPLAMIHSFAADITLTPRLSVGTDQPESIYETKFAAKLSATRSSEGANDDEIQLPLPPQVISLADLSVKVNGEPSDHVAMREGKLIWHGRIASDAPADFDVTYTAMGKGLYSMEAPASSILDQFLVKLTAKGSDVRMLELSMQPTKLERLPGEIIYTWDYKRLMFGRPLSLDVLGIAPIDRLGELSWLGPISVIAFGLMLGLISRAYHIDHFDRWMLLLVLGTFTSAFPLMYFAQEFIPLTSAMIVATILVLIVIGLRARTIIGLPLTINGVVLPAAAIMTLTLIAATHPNLQGIILTVMCLGLFIATMTLAPRFNLQKPLASPAA